MQNEFLSNVSRWIKGCTTTHQLQWLQRMIDESHHTAEVKENLHKEIVAKQKALSLLPAFVEVDGEVYLADEHKQPRVFTSGFSALVHFTAIQALGHKIAIRRGEVFSRIVLLEQAPIQDAVYGY